MNGKAGKFDFIPLLLTTGAGIGLLALPTIIADFILLNCTKKRKLYRNLKEYDTANPNHLRQFTSFRLSKNNRPLKYSKSVSILKNNSLKTRYFEKR